MHAVIRTYSGEGAKELFELLEQRKGEVEDAMRAVAGFASYTLIQTDDGGVTITVCNDKAGTDESIQKAKEWVAQNAKNISASPPKVSQGKVVIHSR